MSIILTMFLAIITSFLLGAQVSSFIPLPLLWGIWAVIIIVVIFAHTISSDGKKD